MVTLTEKDLMELLQKNNLREDALEEEVVERLAALHLKTATAESCTGGLISERITRVSGSSEVFDETLAVLGAVSAETAIQMAEGVKKLSGADIAVSTTGIAGPTGGTAEKPVGLVYMGVCTDENAYAVRLLLCGENGQNDRATIRRLASSAALFSVLSECHRFVKPPVDVYF